MQAKDPYKSEKFAQWRAGLHHVCFRVKNPEDLTKLHDFLVKLTAEHGGKIVQAPKEGREFTPLPFLHSFKEDLAWSERLRPCGIIIDHSYSFTPSLLTCSNFNLGPWAPGYKSVLFEDPDGIRIEFNYVAGKGLLGTKDKKLYSKL